MRFDASRVTSSIKGDLWTEVQRFEDLPYGEEQAIYDAALCSIAAGHDLSILSEALLQMGVDKRRSADISRYLNSRAATLMQIEQYRLLGIERGKWLYSGAACHNGDPTPQDLQRDRDHDQASGRVYLLSKGMRIGNRYTHPRLEPDCKCVFGPAFKGIDY